ncbi:MAG: nucleotidyltransferase family protein [Hyphomicrobiales bacterium]
MALLNRAKRAFARQAWPDPGTDQLIKAVLLPPTEARRHWQAWLQRNSIDDATWPQMKILARLSSRLPEIDPGSSEIPRLNGLAKALWTQSQLRLNKATAALDTLLAANIPVCLMKTAALEAMGLEKSTRRVTSDLDVLVRRSDLRQSFELLFNTGWTSKDAAGVEAAIERVRYHPGINLERGTEPGGAAIEIDVHHQPVHIPFLDEDTLRNLWSSARSATFRGRGVLVPPLEEHLVFTAMQGVRRAIPSHLSSGMWAFDLADGIASPRLDCTRLLVVAEAYEGCWPMLACLSYLRSEIGVPVDERLLGELSSRAHGLSQAMSLYAQAPTWGLLWPINIPLRELALLQLYRRFCAEGWQASKRW